MRAGARAQGMGGRVGLSRIRACMGAGRCAASIVFGCFFEVGIFRRVFGVEGRGLVRVESSTTSSLTSTEEVAVLVIIFGG